MMGWEYKLGYEYRQDGHFLIRKECWHCHEKYDVYALAPATLTNYCDACRFVQQQELALEYLRTGKPSVMPSLEPVPNEHNLHSAAKVAAGLLILMMLAGVSWLFWLKASQ